MSEIAHILQTVLSCFLKLQKLALNVEEIIGKIAQLNTCITSKYVTEDPLVSQCRNAYWFRNSVYLNWANLDRQEESETEANIFSALRSKCFHRKSKICHLINTVLLITEMYILYVGIVCGC